MFSRLSTSASNSSCSWTARSLSRRNFSSSVCPPSKGTTRSSPRRETIHNRVRSSSSSIQRAAMHFLHQKSWTESAHRGLHSTTVRNHGGISRPAPGTGIKVHFKDSKGNLIKTVEASEGDDVLGVAHEYDIDLEGACEGSVACSTCHVILEPEHYDLLPEPEDDENDMLDMAFGLTDTSRLGCQIKLTRELDGIVCTLPAATRNMYVDGARPSTH